MTSIRNTKRKISRKSPFILLLTLALFLHCPKRIAVPTEKIEVLYLGSIAEDLHRDEPILASISNFPGIKIGYLFFEDPFMPVIWERLGFYKLLNESSIDFIVTDYPVYGLKYLSIPKSQGYGIKNYKGIRFAIFSKDKDPLNISEETRLALINERSDVLWIVDKDLLALPPVKIGFLLKNRVWYDTIISGFTIKPNSMLIDKIKIFRSRLSQILNRKIYLGNRRLDDYLLSHLRQKEGVNAILYPAGLFSKMTDKDSVNFSEILQAVAGEMKFKKTEMTKPETQKLKNGNNYMLWGNLKRKNLVLLPADDGRYLFDLIFDGNED